MVTLTNQERDSLTPEELKEHLAAEEKIVFGTDFKKIKGKPVEQGIGAPGRESANHFASIRKYEGEEAYKAAIEKAAKNKKAD